MCYILDVAMQFDKVLDELGTVNAELNCNNDNIVAYVCKLVPSLISNEFADRVARQEIDKLV